MPVSQRKNLKLQNGSTVAVIGGGPAGSFFAWFILRYARESGIHIHVDIFEPKNFNSAGPAGCNKCGGIVSESLIRMLSDEGISIPPKVIHKGIESYTLHLEHGKAIIETPALEQSIASIFRGLGPRRPVDSEQSGFDNFLLELCKQKGANVIADTLIELRNADGCIKLKTTKSGEKSYDLVVGAVGLNGKAIEIFQSICPTYSAPVVTRTHISEIYLGKEVADKYFGNSMHVFLLNLPNIKFGALIPKGDYVTMVLLGKNITREVVAEFLTSETVKSCFPPDSNVQELTHCECYPVINVRGGKSGYADRVVLIGDSASTKLYKNGLGAAYLTGNAAAKTAVFHGISKKDFHKWYQPACSDLDKDNNFGKIIFNITSIIQRSAMLKNGMLAMVIHEQGKTIHKRPMSSILWDTFTGSTPYASIFRRSLNPVFMGMFLWNSLKELLIKRSENYIEDQKMQNNANKTSSGPGPDFPLKSASSIFTDIRYYLLNTPKIKTLIKFSSIEDRERYCESIMQRIGIDVDRYKLLNIHRIGVEAPASFLFNELMKWNGDSLCWPNHIARVNLLDDTLEKIRITLFGSSGTKAEPKRGIFRLLFPQLFVLKAIRIQPMPDQTDTDNARYFLYECSGGYPIGVFSIYVRTSIPERDEHEMSQLFFMVGFNFYGKTSLSKVNFINRIWEGVHNRVTANVSNRFKQLCEWKFENFKNP